MSDALKTFDEAIGEINRRFGQSLPRLADLPADSLLAAMWNRAIVTDDNPPAPILFKACSTDRGFAFSGNITGQLIVYVTDGGDAPLTPCPTTQNDK